MLYLELLLVSALIVLNGVLAMSELAVVSSRPGRLRAMMERGVPGARVFDQRQEHAAFGKALKAGRDRTGIARESGRGIRRGESRERRERRGRIAVG